MLVSLSVSNFRSFDDEQTFSLVASKRHAGSDQNHAVPIPHSHNYVLRAGVIYGANGAGKSNLFKALRFLSEMASRVRDKEEAIPLESFLLKQTAGVSCLDLQFVYSDNLYRYGIKFTAEQVDEEWLVRIVDGKEKTIFERITSQDGSVVVELGELGSTDDPELVKFTAMAKVGGPRNQTFLATVRSTLDVSSWPKPVSHAIFWFILLRLVGPGDPSRRNSNAFINNDDLLGFAGKFLNIAGTGVDRLEVTRKALSEEEIASLVSPSFRQRLATTTEGKPVRQIRPNGDVIVAERIGDVLQYSLLQLKAAHRRQTGDVIPFDIEQESDGTKRILELIPALHSMPEVPLCYFIDEIDRSLHPMMAREFVEFFFKSCQNRTAQLIMTTHESSLLDQDLLRRDEIWFAEKDRQGATKLYSLLDFAPRNDLDLRKNYLQGRFGAIPFFGGMQRLLERREDPAGVEPE